MQLLPLFEPKIVKIVVKNKNLVPVGFFYCQILWLCQESFHSYLYGSYRLCKPKIFVKTESFWSKTANLLNFHKKYIWLDWSRKCTEKGKMLFILYFLLLFWFCLKMLEVKPRGPIGKLHLKYNASRNENKLLKHDFIRNAWWIKKSILQLRAESIKWKNPLFCSTSHPFWSCSIHHYWGKADRVSCYWLYSLVFIYYYHFYSL